MDNKEFSDLNEEGKADFAKAYREKYSEKNFPDAAKNTLFGRTDIGDECSQFDKDHKNPDGTYHTIPETASQSDTSMDIQNVPDDIKLFEDYFLWPKEWFEQVVSYCREQKITIPELIEYHRKGMEFRKFKEELKKDLDDYDKKHYPKE